MLQHITELMMLKEQIAKSKRELEANPTLFTALKARVVIRDVNGRLDELEDVSVSDSPDELVEGQIRGRNTVVRHPRVSDVQERVEDPGGVDGPKEWGGLHST